MLTAEKIKKILNLTAHPKEGGFFNETYRSSLLIPNNMLGDNYKGDRNISTSIYYLLTPDTFSEIHTLISDEIFHFYLGDPIEMLQLYPDGTGKIFTLGTDLESGMFPQVIVKQGVWQGSRLKHGGKFGLMGTTVSPGFDFTDYKQGHATELIHKYPKFTDMIQALTR